MKKRQRSVSKHTSKHKKEGIPPGIKVLIAYTSVILIFYMIYLFFEINNPISIFFGKILMGSSALLVDFGSVILLALIIYGLQKREYWVFWISLAWFSYGVLNAIMSAFLIQSKFDILNNLMLLTVVSVLLLNGLIVWYIYSEKEYFKSKHLTKVTRAKDHVFVYIILSVLIISILLTLTIGINFYKTKVHTINKIIQEFKSEGASTFVCMQKSGEERDLCYVVLAVAADSDTLARCDDIESDFYKLACYRALAK